MSTGVEARVCDQRRPVEVEGHNDVFIEVEMGKGPDGNTSAAPEVVISLPRQAWKIGVVDGRRNGVDDRKGRVKSRVLASVLVFFFFFFSFSFSLSNLGSHGERAY